MLCIIICYHEIKLYVIITCMKINLIYNKFIPDYTSSLEILEKSLTKYNVDFITCELNEMKDFGEIALVIGGDGTLLRAARFYSKYDVPVLGINLGRLGFLAQAGINNVDDVIQKVLSKDFEVEERIMLESNNTLALNDFVIKGCYPSRTSKFCLEINDKFVSDYVADGLIISTPTGSTAYCLSAGGPVLFPTLDALIIVPICPHTLNARPLVVPVTEKITVRTSDELLSVNTDGYKIEKCVEKITIKTSEQKAKLAFINNDTYYSVIRNKLHWGFAPIDK